MSHVSPGRLFVVATPIGNLGDITHRAIETLGAVSVVAAEDTRHTRHLLAHFGVDASCLSLNDHNEQQRLSTLLARLGRGESVALVSDAGTPLISDPGFGLVRAVREAGFEVIPVPGACAAVAALSVSGLPTDRFVFEGFLPARQAARAERLRALVAEARTLIFYESPRRLEDTLVDMVAVFGADRLAVLARELTKSFETIRSLSLSEMLAWVHDDANQQRGECVLLVAGASVGRESDRVEVSWEALLARWLAHAPLKEAVREVVALTGLPRNLVYDRALKLRGSFDGEGENR